MRFLKIIILVFSLSCSQFVYCQNAEMIACFQKSYLLESATKYNDAILELKKVKSDSYALNLRLGWLHYLAGHYQESEKYYAKAIVQQPKSIEAKLGFVLPSAKLKEWDKVSTQYDDILKIDPNNYKANYYRGLMFYNTGSYDKAANYLNKLVELYPFDYDAAILTAWNAYYLKQLSFAKNLFFQAKLIQPGSASAEEGLKNCK